MRRVYLKTYAKTERHDILFSLPRIINSYGIITNSTLLSDYCINFVIELDGEVSASLISELDRYIEFFEDIPNVSSLENSILYLRVLFKDASGELKNIIPNVPGG